MQHHIRCTVLSVITRSPKLVINSNSKYGWKFVTVWVESLIFFHKHISESNLTYVKSVIVHNVEQTTAILSVAVTSDDGDVT